MIPYYHPYFYRYKVVRIKDCVVLASCMYLHEAEKLKRDIENSTLCACRVAGGYG
jgi:hypothetical protein